MPKITSYERRLLLRAILNKKNEGWAAVPRSAQARKTLQRLMRRDLVHCDPLRKGEYTTTLRGQALVRGMRTGWLADDDTVLQVQYANIGRTAYILTPPRIAGLFHKDAISSSKKAALRRLIKVRERDMQKSRDAMDLLQKTLDISELLTLRLKKQLKALGK
jgi:hypothetical protein